MTLQRPLKRPLIDTHERMNEMENPFNSGVRREAVKSLGRIRYERMIGPLVDALKDEDRSVRVRAVGAFAKYGGDVVVEPLIGALNDSDSGVRLRAVQALEELKDPPGDHCHTYHPQPGTFLNHGETWEVVHPFNGRCALFNSTIDIFILN